MFDNPYSGGFIASQPYKLDPTIETKLDPEYVEFFKENLTDKTALLYTHLMPLDWLRGGAYTMKGEEPNAEVAKIYDIKFSRKYTNLEDPEIPARVFIPHGEAPEGGWPVMIRFHGGGWVFGGLFSAMPYCTRFASWSKCICVSVDYRLAPEHPFPAAIEDCYEAVMNIYENPDRFKEFGGININKIAMGGCSAGGNITAVIAHKMVDPSSEFAKAGLPLPVLQVLNVPVCDNTATPRTHKSWAEYRETPHLNEDKMMWYRYHYLPDTKEWSNPEASPIFYSDESFAKQPPAFVSACECDILCTEAEIYAEKLKRNGVQTHLEIWPGVPHVAGSLDGVLTQGKRLVKATTDAVRVAFYGE